MTTYFEDLASRVEAVGGMEFGPISIVTPTGIVDLAIVRGNRPWVDAVAPGLWDEAERVGSASPALFNFLTARARRLGRIH